MEKVMKPWQKGIELDTLVEWSDKFEEYNKYCFSPFAKAKKNGMAAALDKDNLYQMGDVVYEMRTAKTASKIKMFNAGPEIAEVHKGERVITKLSLLEKGTKENLVNVLKTIYEHGKDFIVI